MEAKSQSWDATNRFVAVIDIMGFKDFVLKNPHEVVVERLRTIKNVKDYVLEGPLHSLIMPTEVKSVQFSDTLFIFSISDTPQDLLNILVACRIIMATCITQKIPMKGAISYGKVTTDFTSSIFVGQPIINAHILQDDLQIFGAVLDHNAENKLYEYSLNPALSKQFKSHTIRYKVPTKSGKINYSCLYWPEIVIQGDDWVALMPGPKDKLRVEDFYTEISGYPRIYVDNTIQFIDYLVSDAKTTYPGIKDFILPSNSPLRQELEKKGYYKN